MQQVEFSTQLQSLVKHSERRGQIINTVLSSCLIIILAWSVYAVWRDRQQPKIESIAVENVHVAGPSDLCPGDNLTISYQATVNGIGVVMWDSSILHGAQPVSFSETRRFVVEGPVTLSLRDVWRVPAMPDKTASELDEWLPGQYLRYIAISAPATFTSRFTPPAILKVPFAMKPNCKE